VNIGRKTTQKQPDYLQNQLVSEISSRKSTELSVKLNCSRFRGQFQSFMLHEKAAYF